MERLKASSKLLSRLVPQDVGALARRHELLQAELKTNLVVLATAHAVSEGIIRRLSGDLVRKACPQVYGASGRATAPDPEAGATARVQPDDVRTIFMMQVSHYIAGRHAASTFRPISKRSIRR